MKRSSTVFLRGAVLILGSIVAALCAFALPSFWMDVPLQYPDHSYVFYAIITCMYISAIPFFFALYQAIKLLKYIDNESSFSTRSVQAFQRIALSALAISAIYIASAPFFYMWADGDDAPGLVVVNMFLVLAPFTVAVFAGLMQRLFREALSIKSENEFTV